MIPRMLDIPIGRKSIFLFGPRQTGKSTLVHAALGEQPHITIDLLQSEVLLKYKSNPGLLRSEIHYRLQRQQQGAFTVFIDEIQKAPDLLNDVHWLLENHKEHLVVVLTGSSARKLKRSSVNMLAGRAWEFFLFPLTHLELSDGFVLDEMLLKGSLPPVMSEDIPDAFRTLRAYSRSYLKEEILDEALVRNLPAFSRFFDLAADQSGQVVNYTNMARETGVSGKTIQAYYQILEDTLVALKLEPYLKSARKRLVSHPKYLLFDLGVINSLCGRTSSLAINAPSIYGRLFEQFIILETQRLLSYREKGYRLYHWRSSHGAEVDLVLEGAAGLQAIEIKSSPLVRGSDLRGLRSFLQNYPSARPLCVSTADKPYLAGSIEVLPWRMFFASLV